jgi:hypothetical protein
MTVKSYSSSGISIAQNGVFVDRSIPIRSTFASPFTRCFRLKIGASLVHQTEIDVAFEAHKCLPAQALTAKEVQWRRGDSNPNQPQTPPVQDGDTSPTKRDFRAEKRGSDEQIETPAAQPNDTPKHEIGAPAVHEISEADPDLTRLIEAWPQLSADTRVAILRIGGIL